MAESFWIKVCCLTSPVHNYQDEKCTGTTGYINKYIWNNTVSRLRLVRVKSSSSYFGELLFF
jgi:hypothetical protein